MEEKKIAKQSRGTATLIYTQMIILFYAFSFSFFFFTVPVFGGKFII